MDAGFFDHLNDEIDVLDDRAAAKAVRGRWLLELRDMGRAVLEAAIRSAPSAAMRYWRVQVKARDTFDRCFAAQFKDRIPAELWAPHSTAHASTEETAHDA